MTRSTSTRAPSRPAVGSRSTCPPRCPRRDGRDHHRPVHRLARRVLRRRRRRRRVRGVRVRRDRCVHRRPGQRPGDHGAPGRPPRTGPDPVHRDAARRGGLDPRRQIDARLDFDSLGITVSDRYLLDDQATPASAGLSLGLAILAGLLAALLAVGLVGGYLVFRRSKRPLPSGGRTLGPGDEIPVHVTGALRREGGLLHVREARPGSCGSRSRCRPNRSRWPNRIDPRHRSRGHPGRRAGGVADRTPSRAGRTRGPGRMGAPATPAIPSWSSVVAASPAAAPPRKPPPDPTCRPP